MGWTCGDKDSQLYRPATDDWVARSVASYRGTRLPELPPGVLANISHDIHGLIWIEVRADHFKDFKPITVQERADFPIDAVLAQVMLLAG